jgi:HEAT repeat protein
MTTPVTARSPSAERALKQLGVAIKNFALYPPTHSTNVRSIEVLLATLQEHMEGRRAFTVRVAKRAFSVDGTTISGAHAGLAQHFYTRKVGSLTFLPGVPAHELSAFLSVIAMERRALEAAGGVGRLLWERGVSYVQARELALSTDEELDVLGLSAFYGLIGKGKITPTERDQLLEILSGGGEASGTLLGNVYNLTGEVLGGTNEAERAGEVYEAIRSMDRLILNEPFEKQGALYANLAQGITLLDESVRRELAKALLQAAQDRPEAQVVLNSLTNDQLAQILYISFEDNAADPAEHVAAALQAMNADHEKAGAVLAILEGHMRPRDSSFSLSEAVRSRLRPSEAITDLEPLTHGDITAIEARITEEQLQRCRDEARAINEDDAVRASVETLLDMMRQETVAHELDDDLDILIRYLPWLINHHQFDLVQTVLRVLGDLEEKETHQAALRYAIDRITEGAVLDALLVALWDHRASPVEQKVQACLDLLAARSVEPLIRALTKEERAGMRAVLCDVLVRTGASRVDELSRYLDDDRWYVVRNIVNVLGRLRQSHAISALTRVVRHPEYRVRTEVVDTLAAIGTNEAQQIIGMFVNDPDERVCLKALRALDDRGMRRALPTLLEVLNSNDPLSRQFALKKAVLDTLVRGRIKEALPALRSLARLSVRSLFFAKARELRRLASVAGRIIDQSPVDGGAHARPGGQPR